MGSMMASVEEANAFVCARGVYRAGCAGPLCGAGFIKDVALTLQRSMPFPVALVE
jgi:hypothetical protein